MFQMSHVWFDRMHIKPDVPEHLETLEPMAKEINKLIEYEVAAGTPLDRMILGQWLYVSLTYSYSFV